MRIKLANFEMNVIVITGEGDCGTMSVNNLYTYAEEILTLISFVFNNNIYGISGGQHSSTTPENTRLFMDVNGIIQK